LTDCVKLGVDVVIYFSLPLTTTKDGVFVSGKF
jgi:hypothetical protein